MNEMARQSDVTRELLEINVETVRQLLDVAGRGMGRYLTLNVDYVTKLADRPGPLEIFELQRHYGQSLLTGFREDIEQSGRIIGGALQRSSSALFGSWSDTTENVTSQAARTAANVGEAVGQALSQPEHVLTESQPKAAEAKPAPDEAQPLQTSTEPEPTRRVNDTQPEHRPEAEGVHQRENLERVHGIGRAMAQQLRAAGIETLSQLAAVDVEHLSDESHPLYNFRARIEADHWIDQARALVDQRH